MKLIILHNDDPKNHSLFGFIIDFAREFGHDLDIVSNGKLDSPICLAYGKFRGDFFRFRGSYKISEDDLSILDQNGVPYDYAFLTPDNKGENIFVERMTSPSQFPYTNFICIDDDDIYDYPYAKHHILTRPSKRISTPHVIPIFSKESEFHQTRQGREAELHNHGVLNSIFNNLPRTSNGPGMMEKIPRKIYQTWTEKNLSPVLENMVYLVKKNNPGYEYHLFDDDACRDFIRQNFDEKVLTVYDRIIPGAFKADLFRYCVLYVHGGIYCDIDMICLGSFDSLLNGGTNIFVPVVSDERFPLENRLLFNAFIGIVPEHPIMKTCIDMTVENVLDEVWWNDTSRYIFDLCGPGVLGIAVNEFLGRGKRDSFIGFEDSLQSRNAKIKFLHFNAGGEEFIRSAEGEFFFQNKNGNEIFGNFYRREIEKYYNIIDYFGLVSSGKKPYKMAT
uniref:Glycosyltransferase sugar-binding region containing DXD motif-containing protein n=1 Tax=Candidatus Kentrum sp. DK TaxID=2126562 RepID=A0A450TP74_9GAMM|nr:MAG: Glycosyltransferase sugar-binding region containing DXD motif-containing protein [Candidatus Kentron sp. DK]